MSEELQKKLIEWIEQLKSGAETQLPEIAAQWIRYELASAIVWICVFSALLVPGLFFAMRIYKRWDDEDGDTNFFSTFGCAIAVIFCGSMLFCNLDTVLQIKLAPKAFVVQKITNLARGCR